MTIVDADPGAPDAVALLAELSAVLSSLTGASGNASFDPADVRGPRACFVLAYVDGIAVGCGALRPLSAQVAELKRMYAQAGSGAGGALLAHLEARASSLGYHEIWLETRKVNTRAVRFYERHGYRRIDNYGRYAGVDTAICLATTLPAWRVTAPRGSTRKACCHPGRESRRHNSSRGIPAADPVRLRSCRRAQ